VETSDLRGAEKQQEPSPSLLLLLLLSPPGCASPARAASSLFAARRKMATGGDKCGGGEPAAGGDLYGVLGLNKECSDADLKVAYRKLAMKWHPDRCSSSSSTKHMDEAKEKFQQIQGAYSGLNLPCLNLHPLPHIYVFTIHPASLATCCNNKITRRTDLAN
jgi:hypothetical protein